MNFFVIDDLFSKSNTIFFILYILYLAHRLKQTFPGRRSFGDGRYVDMCRLPTLHAMADCTKASQPPFPPVFQGAMAPSQSRHEMEPFAILLLHVSD